ncbi:MAG: bifunctional 5,10-methylenetetrahydrofolate dehydrogenase/5,10-methenyltetrahydrofolate cyclohydrolase [TACK group archaeon]|nr:bifunctional 5,10-methylenetetrahydrofolate dehydrogenase/5,10-methenyltetrahydrofolate cyclohydrolase [TACK group archaeon]
MILDGRPIAQKLESNIAREALEFQKNYGIKASLHIIVIGNDDVANLYAETTLNKLKALNMDGEIHRFPESTSEKDVIDFIKKLSSKKEVHGIIVNAPVPKNFDLRAILSSICTEKDVDGQNPYNLGMLMLGVEEHAPATPKSIVRILEEYKVQLSGKKVCIINRSPVVGKPLAMLLLNRDATVNICHTKTEDLPSLSRSSDIVVVAVGKPMFLKEHMVAENSVVIDVGINKYNGKIVGDADFENLVKKVSMITPVPGGVGTLQTVMIIEQTLKNAQKLMQR